MKTVYYTSARCAQCRVLWPEENSFKTFPCTAESGNRLCPAGKIRLCRGLDVEATAAKIVRARENDDQEALNTVMNVVSQRTVKLQGRIQAAVDAKTEAVIQPPTEKPTVKTLAFAGFSKRK